MEATIQKSLEYTAVLGKFQETIHVEVHFLYIQFFARFCYFT